MDKGIKTKFLQQLLDASDISIGDIVLISSEMMKIYCKCMSEDKGFKPDEVLNALMECVGKQGMLLLPTYNWDFCHGKPFDYLKTRGATGALGNAALARDDFKRTRHPIYSFAVWGRGQEELYSFNNTDSFGDDSVFAYLHKHGAYNILWDVDYNHCFTFLHYVEETVGCPYRYVKDFTGKYIDSGQKEEERTYSMFVRDLDMDVHMISEDNRFEEYLLNNAGASKITVDGIDVRKIRFDRAFEAIKEDIIGNRSKNLCSYKGQYE